MQKLIWDRHNDRHHWWETVREVVEELSSTSETGKRIARQKRSERHVSGSFSHRKRSMKIHKGRKQKKKKLFLSRFGY